jgi:Nucleotidyl transferase AbiEii toxin, Type IV TA system
MNKWLELPKERRAQILNQVSVASGILPHAIEKDWWVTITLTAIFSTTWKGSLVFKGGTSLTKSWKLIERFSEDIDLAIDKTLLGFEGEANKSKVEKLRRAASNFVTHEFKDALINSLLAQGIPEDQFTLSAQFSDDSIRDPQILELSYVSVLESNPNPYLKDKVIIELGARSLMEPSSQRALTNIISETLPDTSFAEPAFMIQCVKGHF